MDFNENHTITFEGYAMRKSIYPDIFGAEFFRILLRVLLFLTFIFSIKTCFGQSSESVMIQGTVMNQKGEPIPLANVYLQKTLEGTVTNENGNFVLQTDTTGSQILIVSYIGYEPHHEPVELEKSHSVEINIRLKEKLVNLANINITASSFTTGGVEGVTLSPLEVVTTPGAAADIFRAFQSFPGVSMQTEGSGLFVRGGDVSETKILLDQATVAHPYKYETPTGGIFGTIPPFLVSGTFFSTGGFPARYGNALSGVLSMKSQGLPDQNSADINVGLSAASLGISTEIVPEKLGINFSGNKSFTETMFRLNGLNNEFTEAPSSTDLNASLIYKPKPTTTFKLFSYVTMNNVGVSVEEPSFRGNFKGDEFNQLYNLQWTQLFDNWIMENSFSMNRFAKNSDFGLLDLDTRDYTYKARSDWERSFSDNLKLYTGTETVWVQNDYKGKIPENDGIMDPNASFYQMDEQYGTTRLGSYIEIDFKPAYRWMLNAGIRSDYHEKANQLTADPRFSIQYQLTKQSSLRASTGIYHQFPQPFQFNSESGNPDLTAQRSVHYILGFEHKTSLFHFRTEGYYKTYDALVISDNQQNLSNRGYGHSRGIDLFLRYSEFLQTRFNGWISYSFLKTERYQAKNTGNSYDFEKAPSDFDITHNLSVVGKVRLISMIYAGMTYRFATGRPYTPIIDAFQPEDQNYYIPTEGNINSQRLPDFHRLDLNLSYYHMLPNNQSITFYLSVSNALNRKNITDYAYNQDYTSKSPVYSNYQRFFYFGITANLNL